MTQPSSAILIVSPVRNEAAHIERVVRAVARQELTPARWILIDDGSDDGTLEILRRLEREVSFLSVHQHAKTLAPARDRLARAAELRAFNAGLALAGDLGRYTHVMKLDGDIELSPDYLRRLMERFAADPLLGIAGGVLDEPDVDGGLRRLQIARNHVHGALKCFTVECFRAIGGLPERLGWDTVDETYARMRGFRTISYPDLVSVHHRPVGTADGALRGHARHGECAYIVHQPLSWVMLRALRVGRRRPLVISGLAFVYGFARAAARGVERVPDADYRRFARHEFRQRLRAAVWTPSAR